MISLLLPYIILLLGISVRAPVIFLEDIDSGLTSPTGDYRWLDVANQSYSSDYRNSYNYTQAFVKIDYVDVNEILRGTLVASNLKPNFAYQLKLAGTPGTDSNERIGLAGRWWQEEWNGTAWTNGQNLNNKGDGSSPNPNDNTYFSRRNITNLSSPTGFHYRFTGYLVFDYFITDEYGNATFDFNLNSSYHVLWKTSQRSPTVDDGPLKTITFDADISSPAYDVDYPPQTITIFGEWERLPIGGVFLQPGYYECNMVLTEESFHGDGGTYSGNWAAAMGNDISFSIPDVYVDDDADSSWYDAAHVRTIQEGINNAPSGDTVFVYNGIYYEDVNINKKINLIGEDRNNTIIDGGGNSYELSISASYVNVTGFTFRNGGASNADIDISSDNNNIYRNKVINNSGIFGSIRLNEACNNSIFSNDIIDNHNNWSASITVMSSSNMNNIYNNNVTGNGGVARGIEIYLSSNYNNIYNNIISNTSRGICIQSSANNMTNNTISNNRDYGIWLNSPSNLIYQNNFINNTQNADDSASNFWYNEKEGNYWDDYPFTDDDCDGIGDTPYDIPGGSNKDNYPLMNPWNGTLPPVPTPGTVVSISPSTQTVEPGETFTVSVYVEPGEPIMGVSFDKLSFNSNLIHANSVTEGDLFDPYDAFFSAGTIDNTAGEITNVYGLTVPANTVTDPGFFCNISFTAQQQIGTSSLDLQGVIVSDVNGLPATITTNNGSVTVEEQAQYTLTVFIIGNGTITKNPRQSIYIYGTIVELTANADPGWTFSHWDGDLTGSNNPESITMDGSKTVNATFADIIPPEITDVMISKSDPVDTNLPYGWENITCMVTDNVDVDEVRLNTTYPDLHTESHLMTDGGGGQYYYNTTYVDVGTYSYYIWAKDTSDNSNMSSVDTFEILPNYDVKFLVDRMIDISDLNAVCLIFGNLVTAGSIREDVNNDGWIDISDLNQVCLHFGESW